MVESSLGNRWGYASKGLDECKGLVQFGKRDYDPKLGRWLTPDPLGFADGPNLYAYERNNPLILYDSYGLAATDGITLQDTAAWNIGSGFLNGVSHPINTWNRYEGYIGKVGRCLGCGDFSEISNAWNQLGPQGQNRFIGNRVGELGAGAMMLAEVAGLSMFKMGLGLVERGAAMAGRGASFLKSRVGLGSEALVTQGERSLANSATRQIVEESATITQDGMRAWANPKTLKNHFVRHGDDFSAKSASEYAQKASDFLVQSQKCNLPTKVDSSGVIRVYDFKTNTFGAYRQDGSTLTFYNQILQNTGN